MTPEQKAWEHIQDYHLDESGKYYPLLMWSTPVEEVAHMRALGICPHAVLQIYGEEVTMEDDLEKLSSFFIGEALSGTIHNLELAIEAGDTAKIDRLISLLFRLKDELLLRLDVTPEVGS